MGSPHICPSCGSLASAFAAGCSICGAALDPHRAQGRRTLLQRVRSALALRSSAPVRVPVRVRGR
jgi:predicted amidophosphoribosyltransferase